MNIEPPKRIWQGIPGIEKTAKGRLFVTWFSGGAKEPEPENTIYLCTSDDGGQTFTEPAAVVLPTGQARAFDPTLWIDPAGKLWLIFNRGDEKTGVHGVHARICDEPDAPIPIWGEEFSLGLETPYSFRMNKPTVLSSGEWVMPVTHCSEKIFAWFAEAKQRQGVAISKDDGKTWSLHGSLEAPAWALENMIVERRNGSLWMLIRTGGGFLWESESTDRGCTWSEAVATTIANPGSRFFIRRLRSGNLLLVNHYKFEGRSHLTARLSTDDGQTWNEGLLLDERAGVSYPDGIEDAEGLIRVVYDRNRGCEADILMASFTEEDVAAGADVGGKVVRKQVVNTLENTKLLETGWEPKSAADHVMDGLVRITGPEVLGAHDAEFVCVGDHAFIVTTANDERPGEHPAWPFCYVTLSVVHLPTLTVEKRIPMARSEQVFANATLPVGACFVPRILRKDERTLRCYFSSGQPGQGQQTQTWFIDFDLGKLAFSTSIHQAMLKTKAGIVPMQPRHFFDDAVAHGFKGNPSDHALYIIDSFKVHDGKTYVGINNFDSGHNALAVLNANLDTFEIVGHFTEPQGMYLTENAVNRMPDGTWMAICRQDAGDFNYAFATSKDGIHWTPAESQAHVPNGTNSKPIFDQFGGVYYLGWQEAGEGYRRIFNIDVSRDGKTWERKYRFESEKSFQYPSLHEHKGSIWMTVTQGVSDPSGKEMIMFGKLEDKDPFKPQPMKTQTPLTASQDVPASIHPDPEWSAQASEDAKQDFTSIPYDGITPNKMVCDTTLREMPDGSWALFMLAGDDFEPSPKNFTGLTRSFDKGKTWTPLEAVPLGLPREGKTVGQGPTELMTIGNRSTLFFSTHSRTWGRDWQSWFIHSDDNCKTWSSPQPVPGRLAKFTFIRNHIVTRDGRIMLPFQHYLGPPAGTPPPPEEESPWHGEIFHYVSNPRNGVLISSDGGKTWTEHGDIRLTPDDRYYGWAENNIAELADGRIAMIIRSDKSHGERAHLSEHLGGALYYAESKDGGKTWPEFAVRSDIPNPGSKATLYPLGGDTVALLHNPNPKGRYPLALWISFDGMRTWPYQRVLVEHSCDGPGHKMNYPDGFVSRDKQWLHFAYDDNRHRAVHYSAKLPPAKPTRNL